MDPASISSKEGSFSSTLHIMKKKSLHVSMQTSRSVKEEFFHRQKCLQFLLNSKMDYFHQQEICLDKNSCMYPASSSVKETFFSSALCALNSNFLNVSSLYFIEGIATFINITCTHVKIIACVQLQVS